MHDNQKMAVQYASVGWKVYPVWGVKDGKCLCNGSSPNCKPGKHPYTPAVNAGHKQATSDVETIREWFKGELANVGINVQASGLVVLDFDVANGKQGLEQLAEWEGKHGKMPITPTAKTGGGGRHYYFKANDVFKATRTGCWDCVDVIANTAVIAPPSNHISCGKYEWLVPPETPLAEVPSWFVEEYEFMMQLTEGKWQLSGKAVHPLEAAPAAKVASLMQGKATIGMTFETLENLPSGGRNGRVNAVIGSMLANGFDIEEIEQQGVEWASKQSPPYDMAELRAKIHAFALNEEAKQEANAAAAMPQGDIVVVSSDVPPQPNNQTPVVQSHDNTFTPFIGLIGETVKQIEPQTEADPHGILFAILTSFGNAVGHQPYITIGARKHHANIFTVLHGKTGTLKGEPWHICRLLMQDAIWQDNCHAEHFGSGEGLVERVRDEATSFEGGQTVKKPGVADKRLMVIDTEFRNTLTLCRRNESTLGGFILKAWDGDVMQVMNRQQNALRSSNHHISILGNITTMELEQTLQKGSEGFNGFANRFLWVGVKRSKLIAFPQAMQLGDLPSRWQDAIEVAKQIGEMTIDESFRTLYTSLLDALVADSEDETLSVSALERARAYVYRLSMLYALIDGSAVITAKHLEAAYAAWQINAASCRSLFNRTNNTANPLRQRLLDVIRCKGDVGINKTTINNAFSRHLSAEERDIALAELEGGGLIRRQAGVRGNDVYFAVSA